MTFDVVLPEENCIKASHRANQNGFMNILLKVEPLTLPYWFSIRIHFEWLKIIVDNKTWQARKWIKDGMPDEHTSLTFHHFVVQNVHGRQT